MPRLFTDEQVAALELPPTPVEEQTSSGPRVFSDAQVSQLEQQERTASLEEGEYTTMGQTALAGAEAFARGVVPFGLTTKAEMMLGIDPEDIRKRQDYNPGVATAGEIGGLVAGLAIPGSQIKMLDKAGRAVAKAAGLGRGLSTKAPLLAQTGAQAINQAVQGALAQSSNEAHRLWVGDPNQSVSTAITNVGLASALGGGLGAAGPSVLKVGGAAYEKAQQSLSGFHNKAQRAAAMETAEQQLAELGLEMSPAQKAALLGDDVLGEMPAVLKKSASRAGETFRKEVADAEEAIADAIVVSTGRSKQALSALPDLSEYEVGNQIKKAMKDELEQAIKPVSTAFEPIEKKFKTVALPDSEVVSVQEKLSKLALDEGYALSPSAPGMRELRRIQKELPNLKTLEDLRKYQSVARDNLMAKDQYRLSRQVSQIFRDVEDRTLTQAVSAEAPELLGQLQTARAGYKDLMGMIDDLNDRLRVGKYFGPQSFVKALDEMTPEKLVRRTGGLKDAEMLELLGTRLPKTGEIASSLKLDRLLRDAHMAPGALPDSINTRKFFGLYDKLSPEVKATMFDEQQRSALETARDLLSRLPKNVNPSGTAQTLDQLMRGPMAGAAGLLTGLTTGSPMAGIAAAAGFREFAKEAPDAMRLAMLRMLGKGHSPNPVQVAQAARYAKDLIDGENLVSKAVKRVLTPGAVEVMPKAKLPSASQLEKLDKIAGQIQNADPLELSDSISESMGTQLDSESAALATTMGRVAMYLQSRRPKEEKSGPMGARMPVPATEQRAYERTLGIAQQPLVVLQHLKDGTLTKQDVIDLASMYPEMAQMLQERLLLRVSEQAGKADEVPHRVKMGLSLLLDEPLLGSLRPGRIAANQPAGPPQQQGGTPAANKVVTEAQGKALQELATNQLTPEQARVQEKASSNKR